jgi:hypothetical protein
VDPWLSVSAAHNIAEAVRHQLQKQHPEGTETFVHIGVPQFSVFLALAICEMDRNAFLLQGL